VCSPGLLIGRGMSFWVPGHMTGPLVMGAVALQPPDTFAAAGPRGRIHPALRASAILS